MKISKAGIIKELKYEIENLYMKPGDIISEATLTTRYGLSRTPIRDILKQLEQDGYIDISPQKASKVSFIDLKSVEQVIFLRSSLEKEILKNICTRTDEVNINDLSIVLNKQKELLVSNGDYEYFLTLDDEFHRLLFEISNHIFLWEIIQKYNVNYKRYRKLHMLNKNKLINIYEEHKLLAELIKNREVSLIEELINKHITSDINSNYFKENFTEFIL